MKPFAILFKVLALLVFLTIWDACKKEKQCPEGYGGDDCSTEVKPKKVRINSITLTKFPAQTPDSMDWDTNVLPQFAAPDIFFVIASDTAVIWRSQIVYDDTPPGTEVFSNAASATGPIDLDPDQNYTVAVVDYDGAGTAPENDFIGGISGKFYTAGAGFPTSLVLGCSGCAVEFKIEVKYIH